MFIISLDLAEVCCPFIKMIDVTLFQQISLQVSHHCVKLGHTVADRRAYNHKVSIQTNADFTLYKNVEITAPIDSTINMYADLSKSDIVHSSQIIATVFP